MKTELALVLAVAASFTALQADAQTYQWKDRNGHTVISDTPPPGTAKTTQVLGESRKHSSESTVAAPSDDAKNEPKTTAEKDLEFKKRQQEARDKAEKAAKEQAAATAKKENCEQAKRSLAALESSQPLATLDENGQQKVMDNGQREHEMERARQVIAESCK